MSMQQFSINLINPQRKSEGVVKKVRKVPILSTVHDMVLVVTSVCPWLRFTASLRVRTMSGAYITLVTRHWSRYTNCSRPRASVREPRRGLRSELGTIAIV